MKAKNNPTHIDVLALWRKKGLRENLGKWLLITTV